MISLSNRLLAIADGVDKADKIIDIGCDHGLLDIYLVLKKNIKKPIASDILEAALKHARNNIKKYKVEDKIDIRCGNGLDVLTKSDNVNTIIISGMGHQNIIKIINNSNLTNINKIIVQSNTFSSKIRVELRKKGYYIFDEKLVSDKKKIYTILIFKKGYKKYSKKELLFGPILLQKKPLLLTKLIETDIEKCNILLESIPKIQIIRRIKIIYKIKYLYKVKKTF